MKELHCDGKQGCCEPITHIDHRGFIYCSNHAPAKNDRYTRSRKLRSHELNRLKRGKTITKY